MLGSGYVKRHAGVRFCRLSADRMRVQDEYFMRWRRTGGGGVALGVGEDARIFQPAQPERASAQSHCRQRPYPARSPACRRKPTVRAVLPAMRAVLFVAHAQPHSIMTDDGQRRTTFYETPIRARVYAHTWRSYAGRPSSSVTAAKPLILLCRMTDDFLAISPSPTGCSRLGLSYAVPSQVLRGLQ